MGQCTGSFLAWLCQPAPAGWVGAGVQVLPVPRKQLLHQAFLQVLVGRLMVSRSEAMGPGVGCMGSSKPGAAVPLGQKRFPDPWERRGWRQRDKD